LSHADDERFRFPPGLWVKVIYDFAAAYHNPAINRDHLLRSLTPLYLGRTASFVNETQDADAVQVEEVIEGICREFEIQKNYLVERWGR
jgi:hypothetical protein